MAPWLCRNCGRRFGRTNQSHECRPGLTLREYLVRQPPELRATYRAVLRGLEKLGPLDVDPVDAVVLSPVFAPRKGQPALGVGVLGEAVERLAKHSRKPQLYALGGVDARAARELGDAGVGVAAIGAVFADDPQELLVAMAIQR